MASAEEALKAENARLVAEMASMKKKIMVAFKKQQTDLQAKLQAAEQRAFPAEAAAAARSNKAAESSGENGCVDACMTGSSIGEEDSAQSSFEISSHGGREDKEEDDSTSRNGRLSEIERLKSDLQEEKRIRKEQEDAALVEKQKLLTEISNLKEILDGQLIQQGQMKVNYESEVCRLKKDATEQIETVKAANEKLENQLLGAAGQISEAFARITSTQEEMEHVMKEAHETRHAHANLLKEHGRACEELEQVQQALLQAQKDAESKAQMEVAVDGRTPEDKVTLESLMTEKAAIAEQLCERTVAFSELQKHAADLETRLSSFENRKATNLKISDDKSLETIVSELQYQNEFLLSQLQEIQQAGKVGDRGEQAQLDEQVQLIEAQSARSDIVNELRTSLADAEQRAEQLTVELTEVKIKMEEEIKAHNEKYAELDMKFGKLQKRAKQRIQELQKEKEEVEAQLAIASDKASQASSQNSSLQHDLERVRAQTGDALRSIDAERQQLRNANNRQREIIEDLHRNLEAKEQEQKEVQRFASEKDQMVHELTDKLMEMEETHGAVLADLVAKHQKLVKDLEGQLDDAVQERTKATETISSLQMQLAEKESQIAELDAASSGEAVRLSASLEVARGDLTRIEQEHRKDQETWEASIETLKLKLEETEKAHLQQERAAAKERSQMESELQKERQALSQAQAELADCREQAAQVENEFAAYKVRAYSLLQKKEAELSAAKDAEQVASQEAALKEAQRVASSSATERDRALKALQNAMVEHENQLAARSVALLDAEHKIRELAAKVEATKAQMLLEEEAWQSRVDEINTTWQEKYECLRGNVKDMSSEHLNKEIILLKDSYAHLKEEHEAFRDMANNLVESKDQEIARLLDEIREMQKVIADKSKDEVEVTVKTDVDKENDSISSIEIAEQQILILARQQAQREEELAQCRRHIQALQEELAELEHENRLHTQQESALKEELRSAERSRKREGVDMTYVKNVILKLLETGEVEALLPVIAMLLQFSPEELRKCQEVYNAVPEASAAVVDAGTAPRTLLSRFMFSKSGR